MMTRIRLLSQFMQPRQVAANIRLMGVRLDVSGLDVDAQVAASLSSAGAGGINFGSGAGVSAARHVGTVKAGIKL